MSFQQRQTGEWLCRWKHPARMHLAVGTAPDRFLNSHAVDVRAGGTAASIGRR
jgi:hypothetical protein